MGRAEASTAPTRVVEFPQKIASIRPLARYFAETKAPDFGFHQKPIRPENQWQDTSNKSFSSRRWPGRGIF
jgi:hypothetical protein